MSPRWLVASLVVFSLGGVAALLSPRPEESVAQHTAAAEPSSVPPYFAPRRTATPPPAAHTPAPRPLTRTVNVQAAALPRAVEPPSTPAPAVDDSGGADPTGTAAEQSGPDRWSPQQPEEQEQPSAPAAEERCGESFITLWSDCAEEDAS